MTWLGAFVPIIILPVLLTLQAPWEGQHNAPPTPSSTVHGEREAGAVTQVTLRIEGMT